MDKITSIINNNLRSVIDAIRQHLSESEDLLEKVNNDMDKKMLLAQEYKEEVSESKDIINSIEDEISGLEKDLNDLNAKFGDTDFKEILSAGNKEINTKIIEKRGLIQKESQKILNLTEKARKLKEDLIDLREKKNALEYDIKETKIVEKYYSTKVNEIIEYVEAGNDLETFLGNTPQEELMTNTSHEEEFIKVSQVLNDRVFEEIDEITSSEPDASLVEEALKNAVKVTYVIDETPETSKEEIVEEGTTSEEVKSEEETNSTSEEKIEVIHDGIEAKPYEVVSVENLVKKPVVEEPIDETTEEIKEEITEAPKEEKTFEENTIGSIDEELDKTIAAISYPPFDDETFDLSMLDDDIEEENSSNEEKENQLPGEESKINFDDSVFEINIDDDEEMKNDNSSKVTGEYLSAIGFDSSKVKAENIKDLMDMDKSELDKNIDVLKKHNLALSSIYTNANVITKMQSEKIDEILTTLENVSKDDLSKIVSMIDKIDIDKLKESIEVNKDKDLIDIIIPSITKVEDNIKSLLSMTDEEYETMKSSVSEETYKKLNLLSDTVVENYNVLNNLGITDIRECLTKYPTKLLTNPKDFKSLLDKYDQEDLVRCINKNAKVFDKI